MHWRAIKDEPMPTDGRRLLLTMASLSHIGCFRVLKSSWRCVNTGKEYRNPPFQPTHWAEVKTPEAK